MRTNMFDKAALRMSQNVQKGRVMTQHTPGPWIQRGEIVVTNRPMLGAYNEVSVVSLERPVEERLANARLIAAAPDMLQALLEVVYAVSGELAYEPESATAHAITLAQQAIAKAEGG